MSLCACICFFLQTGKQPLYENDTKGSTYLSTQKRIVQLLCMLQSFSIEVSLYCEEAESVLWKES